MESPQTKSRLEGMLPEWMRNALVTLRQLANQLENIQPPESTRVVKEAFGVARQHLNDAFLAGAPVRSLVSSLAHITDLFMVQTWTHLGLDQNPDVALIAVGGYGRGELHPYSDIDLLILMREENATTNEDIQKFLTFLWDIGLDIGHAVRTPEQCQAAAGQDVTIMTNLIESRLLTGNRDLFRSMKAMTSVANIWPSPDFFAAKLEEQRARHEKYDVSEYNLEPNLKGCPGGLRDIQMIGWVIRRHFGFRQLDELVSHQVLTRNELNTLLEGEDFLWRVRYALHILANRNENRLLFDHQKPLASMLGYKDREGRLAVEQLMKHYYRTIGQLAELNDVLLQVFNEQILQQVSDIIPIPGHDDFQAVDGYLEPKDNQLFSRQPVKLIEIFTLLAQHQEYKGLRGTAIRQIREARKKIGPDFLDSPENSRAFLAFLQSSPCLSEELFAMARYGVLGRCIPAFGQVIGQMQYDLFHTYTVDAHTLRLTTFIEAFYRKYEHHEQQFPLACRLIRQLPRMDILYIAALFHDIGKGRGGDHSLLGAKDVQDFCIRLGLSASDTALARWLVEQHLLMSTTAQKKDTSDPEIILDFARQVENPLRLDYLYCLTVADINATNATLWNNWRGTLLRQLYTETRRTFRHGLSSPMESSALARETRDTALILLREAGFIEDDVEPLWTRLDDDYFIRHSATDIAWHAESILGALDPEHVIVQIRGSTQPSMQGAIQIFVYSNPPTPGTFGRITACLERQRLSVLDARIVTGKDRIRLDTYIVMDADGTDLANNPGQVDTIKYALIRALAPETERAAVANIRTPRQLRHFPLKTTAVISNDPRGRFTELELVAADRNGLLARIGQVFTELGIRIQAARIATLGERVEDIFVITDANDMPLTDPALCDRLQKTICETIDQDLQNTSL